MDEKLKAFGRVLTIMDELREKCPWDKKQTLESIRHLTIEETYELSDAIMEKNNPDIPTGMSRIKKELGDILLHIIFYSRIASETSNFNIADVCNALSEKLIIRHPHIYGDVKVKDENDVKKNWEEIKLNERKDSKEEKRSALAGVPVSLPAMIKAHRIQEKARGVGFDWEKPEQVLEKVQEELGELKVELGKQEKSEEKNHQLEIEQEFGDLLFSLINFARFIGVNPEDALEKTNRKFIKRFQYLEDESEKSGKSLSKMSLDEMDMYWNKAKQFD